MDSKGLNTNIKYLKAYKDPLAENSWSTNLQVNSKPKTWSTPLVWNDSQMFVAFTVGMRCRIDYKWMKNKWIAWREINKKGKAKRDTRDSQRRSVLSAPVEMAKPVFCSSLMLPPPQPAFYLHHSAVAWFVGDTHLLFHSADIGGAASSVLCPDTVVRLCSSHWRIHANTRSRTMTGRLLMDFARLLWFLSTTVLFFSSPPWCTTVSYQVLFIQHGVWEETTCLQRNNDE